MYVHSDIYHAGEREGSRVEGICASALKLPSESDEQKAKHFDEGVRRGIAVGRGQLQSCERGRGGKSRPYVTRKDEPSWNFVDNSHPVVTAATASERHKNDLVQRQRDSVSGYIVLDVVGDTPAEGLDGEAEQSSLDRDTVPS